MALEHANRANEDAHKNVHRYGEQVKELQAQIDEDQRRRDEFREKFMSTEKKLQQVKQEQQDLMVAFETVNKHAIKE